MAIRKIITIENERERRILRAKAKKVSRFDPYLERLVSDMWETMRAAPGVGLAAPQVGESIRVLVAEYEGEAVALVNPEIVKRAETDVLGTEGCLSIPGVVGDNVPRAETVVVKARDPRGKEIRVRAEGWFARILQHEIDHLDGVLFIDRISPDDVREVTEDEVIEEGEVLQESPGADGQSALTVERAGRTAKNGAANGSANGSARIRDAARRSEKPDTTAATPTAGRAR